MFIINSRKFSYLLAYGHKLYWATEIPNFTNSPLQLSSIYFCWKK